MSNIFTPVNLFDKDNPIRQAMDKAFGPVNDLAEHVVNGAQDLLRAEAQSINKSVEDIAATATDLADFMSKVGRAIEDFALYISKVFFYPLRELIVLLLSPIDNLNAAVVDGLSGGVKAFVKNVVRATYDAIDERMEKSTK